MNFADRFFTVLLSSLRSPLALCAPIAFAGALSLAGCNRAGGPPPAMPKPEVQVSTPIVQSVTDFEEFTGHIVAKKTVAVRPRVTGKLLKVYFEEGAEVKEGDALFLIDPQVYQADYDRAMANLTQAQAHYGHAQADYERAKNLITTKAISQADYDSAIGNRDEAKAAVGVAEAAAATSKINLDFCTVRSDVTGRIGQQMIDPGNMAMANETQLTTVVSQDPVYAYFDVDENTTLRIMRIIRQRTSGISGAKGAPANLALSDEKDFPHEGVVGFVDNQLDTTTGTLRFRGIFPNKDRMLSPGLFVRVRLPVGEPHPALLVPERALVSDQGQKFVYVLGDDKTVSYKQVQVGGVHKGLQEILGGITRTDKIVVVGLQRVRDKAEVHATEVAAETLLIQPKAAAELGANGPVKEDLSTKNAAKPGANSAGEAASPQLSPVADELPDSPEARAAGKRSVFKKEREKVREPNKENKTSTDTAPAISPNRTSINFHGRQSSPEI